MTRDVILGITLALLGVSVIANIALFAHSVSLLRRLMSMAETIDKVSEQALKELDQD